MIQHHLLELAATLRGLNAFYTDYLEIAKAQRLAVVHNRMEDLSEANLQMDRLVFRIEELDQERVQLMSLVQENLGIEITRLSALSEVFPCVESDSVATEALKLKETFAQVQAINNTNGKLLKSSREYIRSTIAIVTGYAQPKPEQKFQTYGRNGYVQQPRTQQVRLVNRSI